jgi:hypothetical protein
MMDTFRSGSGFDVSQTSSALYPTYIETSALERLHGTAENNTSFPPATYERNHAIATASSRCTMENSAPRLIPVNEPDIELRVINSHLDQTRTTEFEFSLPSVDRGKDAWLFLSAAFILEILVWGTTSTASAANWINLNSTNLSQASLSHLVFFKNITPQIHRVPVPEI